MSGLDLSPCDISDNTQLDPRTAITIKVNKQEVYDLYKFYTCFEPKFEIDVRYYMLFGLYAKNEYIELAKNCSITMGIDPVTFKDLHTVVLDLLESSLDIYEYNKNDIEYVEFMLYKTSDCIKL